MAGENDPSTQSPFGNVTDGDGIIELFTQCFGLMSHLFDWQEPDTVVMIEASLQGKSATYQVIIQNIITTAPLLNTGEMYQLFGKSSSGHYCKHLNH